ncbi:4-carboxy-2-hydroxymuconate-6-semialdehyde dehydrogenase [Anaerohalosphaera lusitana]|uniref:4-carboxy-2-hydroxymuconate-6-semialdehyde dehydrogenase n=1 Tax=Anaerohalosphaera lusitana TaxID=1936003 RepID=A0A1U9NMZ8_9BACT|nr:Gfo/Idh/MocA family oxidoreductase [Anaerohalosphaera lusitana]AQT69279.1 4-carboxy-2-hydroxymuconate-6-semialdehyde dehydrogenase [Anaerohalosphaera lusitana]
MSKGSGLNRRAFLKRAGAAGAAAIAFPHFVPATAMGKAWAAAPSERIVVGGIGVGSMGTGDLRNFLSRSNVQVVAVCDVDDRFANRAKGLVDKKYGNKGCATTRDYREILERDDLDAVFHALPDHWHSIISVACARKGLHIHGQKPLARTIWEGRQICDAVKEHNVVWQTGSWQRSQQHFRRACELVINGKIGDVKYVEVGLPDGKATGTKSLLDVPDALDWDMWLGPAPKRPYQDFGRGSCHWDWRWIMDYSGGQLTDWAGHHVDIAHWGLGLDRTGPVEIEGRGVYPKDGLYDVPIAYKFRCKYKNGVEMVVANRSQQPRGQGVVWYGEKGWIHVNRGGLWAEKPEVLRESILPNEIQLYDSNDHVGNFLDCVRSGKETITPVEVAHRSISVGLLGEIAMLTRRKLRWNPDTERFVDDEQANRYLSRPFRSPWHIA